MTRSQRSPVRRGGRDLDGERAHATTGAADEHAVAGFDPGVVVEALPREGTGLGQRRDLLEREVGRLDGECRRGRGHELREGTEAMREQVAEDLLAETEAGDLRPDLDDDTGHIRAGDEVRGPPRSGDAADRVAAQILDIGGVERGGPDPHQDLAVAGRGHRHICQLEDVGTTVAVLDRRSHRDPPRDRRHAPLSAAGPARSSERVQHRGPPPAVRPSLQPAVSPRVERVQRRGTGGRTPQNRTRIRGRRARSPR